MDPETNAPTPVPDPSGPDTPGPDPSGPDAPLDRATILAGLRDLPGWELRDGALRRSFDLGGFRAAIDFIVRVGDAAEAADHHPELGNVYARVDVALTSHDVGGVTHRDLSLARTIGALARRDP